DFYGDRPVLGLEPEDRIVDRCARTIQVLHEGLEAAFVLKDVGLVLALIDELDAYARVEEGELSQALGEDLVVELDVGEYLRAGLEAHHRASLGGVAHDSERRGGVSQVVLLAVHLPVATYGQQQIV